MKLRENNFLELQSSASSNSFIGMSGEKKYDDANRPRKEVNSGALITLRVP
jgi:hypothetical protein